MAAWILHTLVLYSGMTVETERLHIPKLLFRAPTLSKEQALAVLR